ncbi:MAG: magnesium/cobalt transporter CorA [Planctomycetales bacterium]|nr:magnesium/cobalt transporter CorA [Planctomycetales bacterium]
MKLTRIKSAPKEQWLTGFKETRRIRKRKPATMVKAMSKLQRRRKRKRVRFQRTSSPGSTPGVISPKRDANPTKMHLTAYGGGVLINRAIDSVAEIKKCEGAVRWLDVRGLASAGTLKAIAQAFGLHPLAMEDVVNTHQRPKIESYDDHLFIVARGVEHQSSDHYELEQLSVFLGTDFVLTFQEREGDSLKAIRKRIQSRRGQIANCGADYLAYALLDLTIDQYFPVVERIAERIDDLEEAVDQHDSGLELLGNIHSTKTDLLSLRRAIRPQRDALHELIRTKHPLITDKTHVYLRDCLDHASQLLDFIEIYRETCTGLRDYQMMTLSNRMNEIMKVLTVISTIFIPLSFVTGLYGMNFDTSLPGNMPELNQPYGYIGAVCAMVVMASAMLVYFWRKGWLSQR